jgi:hypothetical protein
LINSIYKKQEEGRRKKEEGRRKKEEGRKKERKKERKKGIRLLSTFSINSVVGQELQRIPGLWSSVGTRQCPVPTGIHRSGMYFINVESAVY